MFLNLKIKEELVGGKTKEEALKNLEEVVRLVLEDMTECEELSSDYF